MSETNKGAFGAKAKGIVEEAAKEALRRSMLTYAVTDRHWLGDHTLAQDAEAALKGGATFLQLREKSLDKETFLKEAFELKDLCKQYGVPFVIDDDVDIAIESGADGIHVGQSDTPASEVRARIGKGKILGVSAQTVEQALLAQEQGADYLGVGAVFPTGSKDDAVEVTHETLKAICEAVDIPVVAIGGITRDNVAELAGSGIDGIAVISAIFAKEDIEEATRDLKEQTAKALGL